jgi:hypothetical protein
MKNILDPANTFEDFCKAARKKPSDVLPHKGKNLTADQKANNAFARLCLITKVLRGKVKLDYSNRDQKKWYPWFIWDTKTSGFRLHGAVYDRTATASAGGSRLCLDTEEKALYMGTNWIDDYNLILKAS